MILFQKLILFALLSSFAQSLLIGRVGFKIARKRWENVIGKGFVFHIPKTVHEAMELIKREMIKIKFRIVDKDMYHITSEEGYLNKVLVGFDENNRVVATAKYFGYVPDLEFAENLVGKPYKQAVDAIKKRIPSIKIVVMENELEIYLCCGSRFHDEIRFEVDAQGLLLGLPEYIHH